MSRVTGEVLQTAPMANAEQAFVSVLNPDGSLNEDVLQTDFGLGLAEAEQVVSFGNHTGTIAEMLADSECPVRGIVRDAYQSEGLDGVIKKFEGLASLDPRFKVVVTPDTFERERLKKKMME